MTLAYQSAPTPATPATPALTQAKQLSSRLQNRRPAAPSRPSRVPAQAYSRGPSSPAYAPYIYPDRLPPESLPAEPMSPRSGIQLYQQRLIALRSGRLYTRLPVDSFQETWRGATGQASYEQWRKLLALEARAVARSKGRTQLAVMVGDSLSLWFPADRLPTRQIWLNQGISGDTTKGVLSRLPDFAATRPQTIYVMAGVNDLKNGKTDGEILRNLNQITYQLRYRNPHSRIVVQSILPTRSNLIPNARIARLNPWIAAIAQKNGAEFLDLHAQFAGADGYLRSDLTTDGIHLTAQGYGVWQTALERAEYAVAQRPTTVAQAVALRERAM
jgi:lysophospholipase L1-like esterase